LPKRAKWDVKLAKQYRIYLLHCLKAQLGVPDYAAFKEVLPKLDELVSVES